MVSPKRHLAPMVGKDADGVRSGAESIDQQFIALVKARDYQRAVPLIPLVSDINVRDPELGASALHFAAARSAMAFLAELEKRPDLDYGARDHQGYRPSDSAWVVGHNEALGAELMRKERAQSQRQAADQDNPEPPKS